MQAMAMLARYHDCENKVTATTIMEPLAVAWNEATTMSMSILAEECRALAPK